MLNETGAKPRSGPRRGRYLVHFLPLNWCLALVDYCLAAVSMRRKPRQVPTHPKILVSQPGHLGDLIIATAVIEPLQRLFPGSEIGFLVPSWSSAVLTGHSSVRSVHIFDQALLNRSGTWKARWKRHFATRRQALKEVHAARYDVAIELSFNFPNNIRFLHSAGISRRFGYASGGFGPLLTDALDWSHHPDWSVMRYHQQLLQRLADCAAHAVDEVVVAKSLLPSVYSTSSDQLAGESEYTVIHMGSGGPLKEWPENRWSALIDRLVAEGHRLVFTGSGEREKRLIERAVSGRSGCVDLGGKLDWQQFVRVIARAQRLIGVDSAAGHVAAAFGIPTTTIGHGLTDFALYRPQSDRQVAVRRVVPCAPCYRSRGCPSMDCIRDVGVEDVLRTVR